MLPVQMRIQVRFVPVVGDEQLNVSPYNAATRWIVYLRTLKILPQRDPPRLPQRQAGMFEIVRGRRRDEAVEKSRG
jgi:hypothetical protein